MSESAPGIEHRVYPIGAFSEKEILSVYTDSLCAEEATVDDLMNEWREKVQAFERTPSPSLDPSDSDLLSIAAKAETVERIESMLRSYRDYLPPTFDLALVPISKLVTPQVSISRDHASSILKDATGPVSDDENASLCLGSPASTGRVEAAYLGAPRGPSFANSSTYVYQFSSDDPTLKFIQVPALRPIREVDLATEGAAFSYHAKSIPVMVGLGLPIVHVLRISRATGPSGPTVSRLALANGIHRVFRLAELGNTHAAAMVQTLSFDEVSNPLIDGPKEKVFASKPITISTLADGGVSRVFKWKKSKRVLRLQVTVNQEASYVA